MPSMLLPLAVAALAILFPTLCLAAPTNAQKCEATLETATAKFAQCRLNAEAKFTKDGDTGKRANSLARCSSRLSVAFEKASAVYGTACPVSEPVATFDAFLAQCTDQVESTASGGQFPSCGDGVVNVPREQCDGNDHGGETCGSLGFVGGTLGCDVACSFDMTGCTKSTLLATDQTGCWTSLGGNMPCAGTGQDGDLQQGRQADLVDNGDGTVSDINTGLMWEKLSRDWSMNDYRLIFSWIASFSDKVAAMNTPPCFASYCDWRLPNIKELQTIVSYRGGAPTVNDQFHGAACLPDASVVTGSCTNIQGGIPYASSTTSVTATSRALGVDFGSGLIVEVVKTDQFFVRAVRSDA